MVCDATTCVAITGGFKISNVKDLLLVCPNESVALTVYDLLTNSVGVPVILPDVELKLSPAGNEGLTAKLIVPNPPEALTGIVLTISTVLKKFSVGVNNVVVISGGSSTVRANVLASVCSRESSILTV